MTTFLLIRHATTDLVGRALCGALPGVHLNAAGERQAQLLSERLASTRLAAVYSSPLERARETATPIAARHGMLPHLLPDAGEVRFGRWAGARFGDLAQDETWQRWNRFRGFTRAPDGEMAVEVLARAAALLERLRALHADSCVAIVSHADVIKAALAHALGSPIDMLHRFEIQTASISTLVLDADHVRVLGINDTGMILDQG